MALHLQDAGGAEEEEREAEGGRAGGVPRPEGASFSVRLAALLLPRRRPKRVRLVS